MDGNQARALLQNQPVADSLQTGIDTENFHLTSR
jgi:hypothetical protein